MFGATEEIHVDKLQNNALNVVEALCSIVSQPVEQLLHWQFGTRYWPVPISFCAATMMVALPLLWGMVTSVAQMIPFVRIPLPVGIFGFAAFAKLYFAVFAFHGYRLWKRVLHPELEPHSRYEGPSLVFFRWLPKSDNRWVIAIIFEPAFVFLVGTVLQDFYIIEGPLALYLHIAALALMVKKFISWFTVWQFLRDARDVAGEAPILAKYVANEATDEELAPLNMAGFPEDADPETRRAAAMNVARMFAARK